VAGAAKFLAPSGTVQALRAARLPASPLLVRLLGLTELAVGVATIVVGGWVLPAVVALFYAGFSGFVAMRLRAGDTAGCGCFGATTAPLTSGHLVYDVAAMVSAVLFVADPAPSLSNVLADQPWAGVPYLMIIALGVTLSVAVLTVLPSTRAAARPPAATPLRFGPVSR
jgi:hypothetical protein